MKEIKINCEMQKLIEKGAEKISINLNFSQFVFVFGFSGCGKSAMIQRASSELSCTIAESFVLYDSCLAYKDINEEILDVIESYDCKIVFSITSKEVAEKVKSLGYKVLNVNYRFEK